MTDWTAGQRASHHLPLMSTSTSHRFIALGIVLASALSAAVPGAFAGGHTPTNVSNASGRSSSPAAIVDSSGAIHVIWADNPGSDDTTRQQVFCSVSSDGGASFSAASRLSTGVDDDVQPRELRMASSGEVVVAAWWAVIDEGADREFLTAFIARSEDGGASFEAAIPTSLRFRNRITAPKEGYSNTTSLAIAIGEAGEVFMLATVQDYFHGFNVYFARSLDGITFSVPERVSDYSLTIPRAGSCAISVLPAGDVVAFWSEALGDFVDEVKTIYRVVSKDGGRTFSDPTRVAKARGVVAGVFPLGNELALLAQTQRGPRTKGVIKLFRSTDAGETFPRRAKAGSSPAYVHAHQSSVAANRSGTVAIAWTENSSRPGPIEGLYVTISRDGGRTFGEAQRTVDGLFIDPPSVTVGEDGSVGLVYSSSSSSLSSQEIYFRRVDSDPGLKRVKTAEKP